MFGLVCWPGEAGHCLHQLRGGTDVVLIVELVQSFFTYIHMLVLFSIFIYLRCGFFIFIYSLLAL